MTGKELFMASKVFVSYKYADSNVAHLYSPLYSPYTYTSTTVRSYVDDFMRRAQSAGCVVYKGERADEDLSYLKEDTIWQKLKDRIYDSTITLVFISPNMREPYRKESDQWIPWEIAFSLRETTRSDRTSHSNALIFVVLPDRNGRYDYFSSMRHFAIVAGNIQNGYAEVVCWADFVTTIQGYIDKALWRKKCTPSYEVVKSV